MELNFYPRVEVFESEILGSAACIYCKSAPSVGVLSLPSRVGVPIYAPTAVNYCKCRL